MIQLWRIMHAGFRNFLRSVWLSTAATAVMTVTLTVILVSLIANAALGATIKDEITNKIDISIFFKDDVTDAQIQQVEQSFLSLANVESVHLVTKDEALKNYRTKFKDNPVLLSAVSETNNSLPRSLQIKAKDTNKLQSIVDVIDRPDTQALMPPDAKPTYNGDRKAVIDKIIGTSNVIRRISLTASVLFVVISTLIIFNTIRMAIFTRRDEIEIMKLVGATKWFIRGPFIFEAATYGVIAATIALFICYTLILAAAPHLASWIKVGSTVDFFRSNPLIITAGTILSGVVIGAASSLLALGRYLKL